MLASEARLPAVWDTNKLQPQPIALPGRAIELVVPLPLELDDVTLLELLDVRVRVGLGPKFRDGRDEILEFVVLLQLFFS